MRNTRCRLHEACCGVKIIGHVREKTLFQTQGCRNRFIDESSRPLSKVYSTQLAPGFSSPLPQVYISAPPSLLPLLFFFSLSAISSFLNLFGSRFSPQQPPQHHQSLFNCSSDDFVSKLYASRCTFSIHARNGPKLTQHSSQLKNQFYIFHHHLLLKSKFLRCSSQFSSLNHLILTRH